MDAMIFYFDLYEGSEVHKDDYGDHLPSIEDARDMATALVADLACGVKARCSEHVFACEVRIRDGIIVARIEMTLKTTNGVVQL